jgi:hypothetical protein
VNATPHLPFGHAFENTNRAAAVIALAAITKLAELNLPPDQQLAEIAAGT